MLVRGNANYEGTVQFCRGNQWGTVCDEGWGVDEATVVCQQLGLSTESLY